MDTALGRVDIILSDNGSVTLNLQLVARNLFLSQ